MNQIEQIDNPEVLGLTLRTVVNKKYDGPGADDPSRLQSKCIRVLLLPRILDVLCFWMAAGFFAWNYENRDYRYFAIRILNPDSTTDFLPAFIGWKTILATVAFAVIVALTFLLRVSYLKAKRAKTKEPYPATKQMFPDAKISKGQVFFSTVFLMILLVGAHFVASLILKKNWREMPVSVDLGITAGIFALANLHACLKVEQSVVRCYTCHVISSMTNQEFKVTETYYADASVRVPEMKYKHEIKHYRGERLEKTDVTEHTYGEIRTYENVRHDRVRASVRCPYCLQVYEEILAGVNDDLSNKKLKDIQTFHDMKWHS